MDARVAVLASGEGTNLQALLDDPVTGPWIALAVSDRRDARALERARDRGIPTVFVDPSAYPSREAFDDAILTLLVEGGIDAVVLAGFMRVLGPKLVLAFEQRMLNVHPSLLPAFPGTHSVADALEAGASTTGVTVHFVDEGVDTGPIVMQEAVEIRPGDTLDALEARIHRVEHRLLPAALRALVEGRIHVDGRDVRIEEAR